MFGAVKSCPEFIGYKNTLVMLKRIKAFFLILMLLNYFFIEIQANVGARNPKAFVIL